MTISLIRNWIEIKYNKERVTTTNQQQHQHWNIIKKKLVELQFEHRKTLKEVKRDRVRENYREYKRRKTSNTELILTTQNNTVLKNVWYLLNWQHLVLPNECALVPVQSIDRFEIIGYMSGATTRFATSLTISQHSLNRRQLQWNVRMFIFVCRRIYKDIIWRALTLLCKFSSNDTHSRFQL